MREFHIVPHTHWDREWYLPFEEFRAKLVETMDLLLETLESDPRWTHFHLDGQTQMIDDYLSVRPERLDAVKDFVAAGRLSCGPWITLVDQFLVSGESIIRNLEDGMARAGELGGCTMLGYLPDQFGHIGQMPQLLRAAGIERAIVWRGVPLDVQRSSFQWRAPDGSTVIAAYMPFGYGHGKSMPTDPAGFIERLREEETRLAPFLADDEPVLITAGDDHEPPNPRLTDAIEAARETVRMIPLAEHVAALPAGDTIWSGELRSASRANLLPNTYSVRPLQKVQRARAEHLLERYAEPLSALVPGAVWPGEDLREAWQLLHVNGAHDSVCGCSTDEVAAVVDARTERVTQVAVDTSRTALERLGTLVDRRGLLSFNPSPFDRHGVPGLGWSVDAPPVTETPVDLDVDADRVVAGGIHLALEDTSDEGDLYNFCPAGEPMLIDDLRIEAGAVIARNDDITAVITASQPDERFVVFDIEIDNHATDHRVRILLDLPNDAATTIAGAPFEAVTRPPHGEGGPGEIASPWWPARGWVRAGGSGFLSEGVVEYELLTPRTLALTLMRCTGTISRPHALVTRVGPAGPDVATPGAQLQGTTSLRFGVLTGDPGEDIYATWESFGLPFLTAPCSGEGSLPSRGTLLDLDVPVLSSIVRTGDRTRVRFWNPFDRAVPCRVQDHALTAGPHRIETVDLHLAR